MRKIIQFGTEGVEMESNAATPFYFKKLFNKDLLKEVQGATNADELSSEMMDTITQLGYVMRMQAIGQAKTISFDGFIEWLSGFENGDMIKASKDIIQLYFGTLKTSSTAKKKSVH